MFLYEFLSKEHIINSMSATDIGLNPVVSYWALVV